MEKEIKVFEKDYEKFLMLAGKEEKIPIVVRNIMRIFEATTTAITKLYDDIYFVRGEITDNAPKNDSKTSTRA